MTRAEHAPHDAAGQWLDASVRQVVVELALAGAHHGMQSQARVILQALPSLVADRETRQWLHGALLIALGDTHAARAHLAKIVAAGHDGNPTADVLARWLDAMDARQRAAPSSLASPAPASFSASSASSPSDSSRPPMP
ncbi:DUF1039 domain-containing protein [Pandoraea terrigena]|uniref:Type III secretion apparatus n=1 Tax=Pandoraea terrigena TaxID=2508292 RepID=A0A5E4YGD7_9BURK|nr:DUF1039 domain-containing protein [Pandoraea terrigena]VVE47859.1 type III secretion apparatus [Pandoraea terrigena]